MSLSVTPGPPGRPGFTNSPKFSSSVNDFVFYEFPPLQGDEQHWATNGIPTLEPSTRSELSDFISTTTKLLPARNPMAKRPRDSTLFTPHRRTHVSIPMLLNPEKPILEPAHAASTRTPLPSSGRPQARSSSPASNGGPFKSPHFRTRREHEVAKRIEEEGVPAPNPCSRCVTAMKVYSRGRSKNKPGVCYVRPPKDGATGGRTKCARCVRTKESCDIVL